MDLKKAGRGFSFFYFFVFKKLGFCSLFKWRVVSFANNISTTKREQFGKKGYT